MKVLESTFMPNKKEFKYFRLEWSIYSRLGPNLEPIRKSFQPAVTFTINNMYFQQGTLKFIWNL